MDAVKQEFAGLSRFAVVGVSRSKGFGNAILKTLRARGYQAFPVNAGADEVDGEKCFRRLDDLPEKVDAVVAVVSPDRTRDVVADCARLGIGRVWMQQGAESPEAIALCKEKGLAEVHGACILMYARPAGVHAFHGWVWKLLGKA